MGDHEKPSEPESTSAACGTSGSSSTNASVDEASSSLFLTAVNNILSDPSFSTGSEVAAAALKDAQKLEEWCKRDVNRTALVAFSKKLIEELEKALPESTTTVLPRNREKMWQSFYHQRSTKTFKSYWISFLKKASISAPTPTLYQHLTDLVFKTLIQKRYKPVPLSLDLANTSVNEGNALRYASGYVVRRTLMKIQKSTLPFKEDLIECCQVLKKPKIGCIRQQDDTLEEWTNLVDRGGLFHIKESTFKLFCAFEDEIGQYLCQLHSSDTSGKRDKFVDHLCSSSENVELHWSIVVSEFDVEDSDVHQQLLRMLAELYVTVRGFSYASMWMEQYKQAKKKSTQRSKSLRKKLYTDETDE